MRPNAKAHEHISAIVFIKQNSSLQIQNEVCERQLEVPQKDRRIIPEKGSKFNSGGLILKLIARSS